MHNNRRPSMPEDEGEMPELDPPGQFPQMAPMFREEVEVRENVDREDDAEAARRARAKKARARAIEDNPFIADEGYRPLPDLPDDDPDWSYKWMRHSLPAYQSDPAGVDTSNISMHMHGRLAWEPVRLGQLPEKWQRRYRTFARANPALQGIMGDGLLTYHDVVAMRTSKEQRDLQFEAYEYRAKQLRDAVKRKTASDAMQEMGAPVRYQDTERFEYE